MDNYELFEEALEEIGLTLEKKDFDNKYGYILRQSYENFNTVWIIGVNHNGDSLIHNLEVNIMSILPYKVEETLKFLNELNNNYLDATFFLEYDEEEKNYDIRLRRSYITLDQDFNGKTYLELVFLTNELLKEVVPKLIRLKYN